MTITINAEDADRILGEIVQEYGRDYVYPSRNKEAGGGGTTCFYVWKGEPDCLIGKLLARLGATKEFLGECDKIGGIRELYEQGQVVIDATYYERKRLVDALASAQSYQDHGGTWGVALDRFRHHLALV